MFQSESFWLFKKTFKSWNFSTFDFKTTIEDKVILHFSIQAEAIVKDKKVNRHHPIIRSTAIYLIGFVLYLILAGETLLSAPKSKLWKKWEANKPNSEDVINHDIWGKFLADNLITDHPSGVNRLCSLARFVLVSVTVLSWL